jgi:D-inositol-3-phosphate glycosyltransferase
MRRPELKVCFWIVGGDISQGQDLWSKPLRALTRLKNLLHISTFVKFVGQRPQDELPYYYNSADVVVMPSHYESFGMVALESMACGTPVITTNVAGISSLIDKKHSALITFVNNPLHLAKQIEHLLTNDSVHKQISRETLESARELDWKNITDKIIKVYEKL